MTFIDEQIVEAFTVARSEALHHAKHRWECPPGVCRFCGERWIPWSGTKLDGHAKCIVTPAFKKLLGAYMDLPWVTYKMVGDRLGVSPSVVRSWVMPISQSRIR